MKRRSKIIISIAIVLSGLVVVLFFARTRIVDFLGSPTNDGSRAVTDGGVNVPGWNGKIDAAEQKAGMTLNDARLAQESGALHITTGPATTYWMSDATAAAMEPFTPRRSQLRIEIEKSRTSCRRKFR